MPSPQCIGFVGFGEVASVFSTALAGNCQEVIATDVLAGEPGGLATLRQRDRSGRVRFAALAEVITASDLILSTVTTRVAEAVARAAAPHLRPGKTFVDLNATAPAVKQAIAGIVAATGAHFVEGAILTAVGTTGARTRILIGDTDGPAAAGTLARLGLNAEFYSHEIGRASSFKLLRSVFSKGLEALLIEFLVAGRRAGVQGDLWTEVTGLFAEHGFEKAADNWIQTHAGARERRYHEVVQVAEELRALGLDPVMTAATEAFFARSRALNLGAAATEKPDSSAAAIAAMDEALQQADGVAAAPAVPHENPPR